MLIFSNLSEFKLLKEKDIKTLPTYLTTFYNTNEKLYFIFANDCIDFYNSYSFYKINQVNSYIDSKIFMYQYIKDKFLYLNDNNRLKNLIIENIERYMSVVKTKERKQSNLSYKVNILYSEKDFFDKKEIKVIKNDTFGDICFEYENLTLILSLKFTVGFKAKDIISEECLYHFEKYPTQTTLKELIFELETLKEQYNEFSVIVDFLIENIKRKN